MNLAFPIAVFAILFTLPHDTVIGTVTITGVSPDSPAQKAGLRPGDTVLEVEGKRVANHIELVQAVMSRLGRPTEFTIRRGLIVTGLAFSPELAPVDKLTIVPRLRPPEHVVVEEVTDPSTEMSLREAQNVNPDAQVGDRIRQGAIGVIIGTANPKVVKRSFPVWDSVPMAAGRAWDVLALTQASLSQWARGGPDPGHHRTGRHSPGDGRDCRGNSQYRLLAAVRVRGAAQHQPWHRQPAADTGSRRRATPVRGYRMDTAREAHFSTTRGPRPHGRLCASDRLDRGDELPGCRQNNRG